MRCFVLFVAAALLLAAPRPGAAEDWVIEKVDFRLDIQPDNSIKATEALDVDFRGLERHGIFRDIVSLQTYDDKMNRRYDIRLDNVTDASGQRHQVKDEAQGGIRRFRISDPDKPITEKQTYRIAYRLGGAMNGFPDHDELYWNATGDWPEARIERAVIHVTAPAGSIDRAERFQGPSGSREPCQARFGSAKRDFLSFPSSVKDDMGNALGIAQFGGTAPTAKPWKGLGSGVLEIVESHDGNAYRAVYSVRFEKALYVLHAFQKKSPSGIRTAKHDVDLVEQRLTNSGHRKGA